jgi:hypothetical protein
MQARQRNIVAIPDAGLGRMRRHHAVACVIEQHPAQQMIACAASTGLYGPLIGKLLLDRIEQGALHDWWLLPRQDVALVLDLADIEAVAQEVEQRSPFEWDATTGAASC